MMRRLPGCRIEAFAEAGAAVRLAAIFSLESSCLAHSRAHCSRIRNPHFPFFPPPEPFRHARPEGQKYIQNP